MTAIQQIVHFSSQHIWLVTAFLLALCFFFYEEFSTQTKMALISVQEAIRLLNDNEAVLCDLREKQEYTVQRIRNSLLVSLESLSERLATISHTKVIFLAPDKQLYRVQQHTAREKGKEFFILRGGIAAWIEAGMPVETQRFQEKKQKRRAS